MKEMNYMIHRQIYLLIFILLMWVNCANIDVRQPITVYYDSWVPRFISACCQSIHGITLSHAIFLKLVKHDVEESYILEHELVHIQQEEKYSLWGFYIVYVAYTIWYGYDDNPFEVEAREQAVNIDIKQFTLTAFE